MRRIIRYAMVFHRLFSEPRPGYVGHSLASRLLAEQPLLREGLWLLGEDAFVSNTYVVPAFEKFKDGQEPNQTGFQLSHGTELSSYDYMETNAEFSRRFALAQTSFASFSSRPAVIASHLTLSGAFDWSSLTSGLVIDLGGSRGTDAIHIATQNPTVRVIVQDLPKQLVGAEELIPEDLRTSGRVSFMPYSFFTPQTVSADVYLIKQCLHNWPDHYVVQIFKNQVPALKPGARFVIIDSGAPPPGEMSLLDERTVR
jgi:SAM-dependent methyltransferase